MKKRILFIIILSIVIIGQIMNVTTMAMKETAEPDFIRGEVIANKLNVRKGPSLLYEVIDIINKGEYIKIHAKIDDWYLIQTEEDIFGCVNSKYIKNVQQEEVQADAPAEGDPEGITSALTADEKEVLHLINEQRKLHGLEELKIDDELQNVVRIKAQDMVDNNYFAHQSPTYGSPFDMMKNNQIVYKTAGENIAGNSDNKKAVEAWMNSESHKENILNNSYNYTGIAVVDSSKYGKIFVQMFIGR